MLQYGELYKFISKVNLLEVVNLARQPMNFEKYEMTKFARITHSKNLLRSTGKSIFKKFFIDLCLVALKENNAYKYANNQDFLQAMYSKATMMLENIESIIKTNDNESKLKKFEYKVWLIACEAVKNFLEPSTIKEIYLDVSLNTITLRDAVIMMKYSGESTYSLKASADLRELLIQAKQTGDYKKINLLGEKMLIKVFDVLYPYFLKGIDTSELEL